jgi:hypothetical protein
MPLSEAGDKIKRKMHQEYGEKEGDRVFYSKENGDKKFKRTVTGKSRAEWWNDRLSKLPISLKSSVLENIQSNKSLSWWLERVKVISRA